MEKRILKKIAPLIGKKIYRHGKELPLGFTLVGAVVALASVIFFMKDSSSYIMIGTFIGGIGLVFGHSGVIVDYEKGRYKNYSWILGFKSGKWESLSDYPDLVLLRKKKSLAYKSRVGDAALHADAYVDYQLYFASKNHLKQVLICRFEDKEKCYEEARLIEEQTGRELVQYNPGMQNPRKKL